MVIDPRHNTNTHSALSGKARSAELGANAPKQGNVAAPKSAGESVSLSSTALSIPKIEASLSKVSDVDMSKVERVKAELASGSLNINASSIAEKMISEERLLG
ncbi:MAG: flagellar biosynthesis anti-sigma factor FlgM [Alteromonadaceae bacterium]|nr:MAG: flagellar biosynthesis anti-sigma factor FlgM [Alteromonadaceae bacterium]